MDGLSEEPQKVGLRPRIRLAEQRGNLTTAQPKNRMYAGNGWESRLMSFAERYVSFAGGTPGSYCGTVRCTPCQASQMNSRQV